MASISMHAIIPAAGTGRRMFTDLPKQYLRFCGRTVLEHSLHPFLTHDTIRSVTVVLDSEDTHWPQLRCSRHPKVRTARGGESRMDSVLSGLESLLSEPGLAEASDMVLVHDAARPCFTLSDLDELLAHLQRDPEGGLVAIPATDTVKFAQDGHAQQTLNRETIWLAQTPQAFPAARLRQAIETAVRAGRTITDEAGAMEQAGHRPRLFPGSTHNIKITTQEDLPLAQFILQSWEWE